MFSPSTVIEQLGGNKFLSMTGVSNLMASDSTLSMKIPNRNCNHLKITLNDDDTYTMRFTKLHVKQSHFLVDVVAEYTGVYADQLTELFEETTGLKTNLFSEVK